jgi:signal transduction histidine kinase
MLRQVIDNAIDAMDESNITHRELKIITKQTTTDSIEIDVEDSGPGIPEELLLKVFEPSFSTRSNRGKRTGMGLSMAQEVVTEHGGTIAAENINGSGCRIKITFRR